MLPDPPTYVLLVAVKRDTGFPYDVYRESTDAQMLHQVGESLAHEAGTSYVVLSPRDIPV